MVPFFKKIFDSYYSSSPFLMMHYIQRDDSVYIENR